MIPYPGRGMVPYPAPPVPPGEDWTPIPGIGVAFSVPGPAPGHPQPPGPPPPAAAPPPHPAAIDPRLAMLAETCPMGAGPCGCGAGPPRLCGHPDRPAEVRRADCLGCVARMAWESGVESPEG